ncbi:MAG: CPBP family intramembrane glutamic endopeptidase [Anaerolineales bacterium]|nr:CPBP family intramembrane glutamic endopeptidase [Anaerolineales bacterium]
MDSHRVRSTSGWWDARLFALLVACALVGSAAIVPYALELTGTTPADLGAPLPLVWVASTLQSTLLAAVAVLIGMRLGPATGLGAPVLSDVLHGNAVDGGRLRQILLQAALIGAIAAGVIIVLDLIVFSALLSGVEENLTRPAVGWGFLASFYGGIVEELLLRFGFMTFLVWGLGKTLGARVERSGLVWTGIILAALIFGLGHLPATAAIVPLTAGLVIRALVLNGIPGVAFGWLYWQRGLLAAIVAHFSADIVLHVLFPFFLT